MSVCGVIHPVTALIVDPHGCRLPDRHKGPHEFVSKNGRVYQWETDWECDRCEQDNCDGDWCTIYWEKKT